MASRVKPSQLSSSVIGILSEFENVTERIVDHAVRQAAVETAKEVRDNAKTQFLDGTGEYAKSWSQKERKDSRIYRRVVYAKAPYYRLTHLLEKGHAKVDGGFVEGRPHIAPAADHATTRVVKLIKEGLKSDT